MATFEFNLGEYNAQINASPGCEEALEKLSENWKLFRTGYCGRPTDQMFMVFAISTMSTLAASHKSLRLRVDALEAEPINPSWDSPITLTIPKRKKRKAAPNASKRSKPKQRNTSNPKKPPTRGRAVAANRSPAKKKPKAKV